MFTTAHRSLLSLGIFSFLLPLACFKVLDEEDKPNTAAESPQVFNNSLSSLSVTLDELDPLFNPTTLEYKLKHGKSSLLTFTLHAVPTNTLNSVKLNGIALSSVDYTSPKLFLESGLNELSLTLHNAEDRLLNTYKIVVDRALALDDASLSGLSVSTSELVPVFDPQVLDYELSVPADYTSLTLSPVVPYPEITTLEVNETIVDSNTGGVDYDLTPGLNTFRIKVTGKSGDSKTYLLRVTRATR